MKKQSFDFGIPDFTLDELIGKSNPSSPQSQDFPQLAKHQQAQIITDTINAIDSQGWFKEQKMPTPGIEMTGPGGLMPNINVTGAPVIDRKGPLTRTLNDIKAGFIETLVAVPKQVTSIGIKTLSDSMMPVDEDPAFIDMFNEINESKNLGMTPMKKKGPAAGSIRETLDLTAQNIAEEVKALQQWNVKANPSDNRSLHVLWNDPNAGWLDYASVISSGVFRNLPQMAVTLFGGWAGARALGLSEKGVTGLQVGSAMAQETGSIYQDIYNQTGEMRPGVASVFGIAAGALELPFLESINRKLAPILGVKVAGEIGRRAFSGNALTYIAKEAFKDMAKEGVTEAFQTILEKSAMRWVSEKFPMLNAETAFEIVQAMLIGGIVGGMTGFSTATLERMTDPAGFNGSPIPPSQAKVGIVDEFIGPTLESLEREGADQFSAGISEGTIDIGAPLEQEESIGTEDFEGQQPVTVQPAPEPTPEYDHDATGKALFEERDMLEADRGENVAPPSGSLEHIINQLMRGSSNDRLYDAIEYAAKNNRPDILQYVEEQAKKDNAQTSEVPSLPETSDKYHNAVVALKKANREKRVGLKKVNDMIAAARAQQDEQAIADIEAQAEPEGPSPEDIAAGRPYTLHQTKGGFWKIKKADGSFLPGFSAMSKETAQDQVEEMNAEPVAAPSLKFKDVPPSAPTVPEAQVSPSVQAVIDKLNPAPKSQDNAGLPDWAVQDAQTLVDDLEKRNPDLLKEVVYLHAEDKTAAEIAKATGLDIDAVRSIRIGLQLPDQGHGVGMHSVGAYSQPDQEERARFLEWQRDNKRPGQKDVSQMTQDEYAEHLAKTIDPASNDAIQDMIYNQLVKRPEFRKKGGKLTKEEQTAAYQRMMAIEKIPGVYTGGGWTSASINDSKTKNADGTRSKGYLTFADVLKSLTPEAFNAYIVALEEAGYNGAVKTVGRAPFSADRLMMGFDNIVVHGRSEADVDLAISVAKSVFGGSSFTSSYGTDTPTTSHTDQLAADVASAIKNKTGLQKRARRAAPKADTTPAPNPKVAKVIEKLNPAPKEEAKASPAVQKVIEKLNPEPDQETTVAGKPVVAVARSEIAVKPTLMQFKKIEASDTGTNERDRLAGKWDDVKAGTLLVWEPKNPSEHGLSAGQKYILVNGHHRVEFADKAGVKALNVQVIKESDGISVEEARAYGAEVNIADGKGDIYEQVRFLREQANLVGKDAALERGKQIGARGRKAATVAFKASPVLFDAFINQTLRPGNAEENGSIASAIAESAPNDEALQRVGIRHAERGASPDEIRNLIEAARHRSDTAKSAGVQFDLFGADDSALEEDSKNAKAAISIQREIRNDVAAISGAAKRPEVAAKYGIDIQDREAVRAKLQQLREQLERWQKWATDKELVEQVRARANGTEAPQEAPAPASPAVQKVIEKLNPAPQASPNVQKVVDKLGTKKPTKKEQARKDSEAFQMSLIGQRVKSYAGVDVVQDVTIDKDGGFTYTVKSEATGETRTHRTLITKDKVLGPAQPKAAPPAKPFADMTTEEKLDAMEREFDSVTEQKQEAPKEQPQAKQKRTKEQIIADIKAKAAEAVKQLTSLDRKGKIDLQTVRPILRSLFSDIIELGYTTFQDAVAFLKDLAGTSPDMDTFLKNPDLQGATETMWDVYAKLDTNISPREGQTVQGLIGETEPKAEAGKPASKIASFIQNQLESGKSLTWQELFSQADEAFGGTQANGKYSVKDAYDAMELGINNYILAHPSVFNPNAEPTEAAQTVGALKSVLALVPTQTKRTAEMDEFQQFSTPPAYAYVAAWVANIGKNDTVLEPSAGIGGLALFAANAGANQIVVNELSPRRLEILKQTAGNPYGKFFNENAELINMVLPQDVVPTTVLMNPPFSSTAGRVAGKRDTMNGAKHIESALARLAPGGRLVAIVGSGMAEGTPTFVKWWGDIKKKYNVLANVTVSGKDYAKYGTTFDNNLLVIDKSGPTTAPTLTGRVESVEELIPLLTGVRNGRTQTERASDQPGSKSPASQAEGTGRPPIPVSPAGDSLRAGNGGNTGAQRAGQGTASQPGANVTQAQSPVPGASVGVPSQESKPEQGGERAGLVDGVRGNTEATTGATPGSVSGSPAIPESGAVGGLKVVGSTEEDVHDENDNSVFEAYRPKKARIEGAKKHPTKLAESAAMASVELPDVTYSPAIPRKLIESGALSDAQLEAVVYAGQAHEQMLPSNTERRGFFIGDGTGVGKGREIAGIILDNRNKGRKRAVWVSEKKALMKDAKRDVAGLGMSPDLIFEADGYEPISNKDGILFITYDTLKSLQVVKGQDGKRLRKNQALVSGAKTKLQQVIDWLGADFDGVIAFDEAHNMANAVGSDGSIFSKEASQKALAGVDLQAAIPKARVVYVSATGATEVENLAYCSRLGLWGEGTPFEKQSTFLMEISSAGMSGMELVARDMKATGSYIARSLSYDGVSYGKLEHALTDDQQTIYNRLARGWQTVLENITEALNITGGKNSRMARAAANAQFWSSHQRFFNQVITSMQMPSVVTDIKNQLAAGNSCVLQLVNTNEAAQERAMSRMESDDELEGLDMTPREQLMQFIQNSFPTQQFEEYTDDEGKKKIRPVVDSTGNPVQNPEAVALRDKMLNMVGSIAVPEGPLEILVNEFGPEAVAEITGRKRRVIRRGNTAEIELRNKAKSDSEAQEFQDGKRRILIFSDAGGTGRSFHADLGAKNKQKRIHYLVQPGWRADKAIQGLGRSHRANQAQAPHFVLVTTDLQGQKRFLSSIARRLDSMGALTKGQRQTGSQGLFEGDSFNLETTRAQEIANNLVDDIYKGYIEGFSPMDLVTKLGLSKLGEDGTPNVPKEFTIQQFLNRILSLEKDDQNRMFDIFSGRLAARTKVDRDAGRLDEGIETVKALKIEKVSAENIHTDKRTGAISKYVQLDLTLPVTYVDPKTDYYTERGYKFYRNKVSGKLWLVSNEATSRTKTDGNVVSERKAYRHKRYSGEWMGPKELEEKFDKVDKPTGEKEYQAERATMPPTEVYRMHLLTGALLPIWDKIAQKTVSIKKVVTGNGERILGRQIAEGPFLTQTLKNLQVATTKVSDMTPQQVYDRIMAGDTVRLSNNWNLQKVMVSGDNRIEIQNMSLPNEREFARLGLISERIGFKTRWFLPTGEGAVDTLDKFTLTRPVVDLYAKTKSFSSSRSGKAFNPGDVAYVGAKWAAQGLRDAWNWAKSFAGDFVAFAREASKKFGEKINGKLVALWSDLKSIDPGRRGSVVNPATVPGAAYRSLFGIIDWATSPVQHTDFLLRDYPKVAKQVEQMYGDRREFNDKWEKVIAEIESELTPAEYEIVVDLLEGKRDKGPQKVIEAARKLRALFATIHASLRASGSSLGKVSNYWPHYSLEDVASEPTPEEMEAIWAERAKDPAYAKKMRGNEWFRSEQKRKEGEREYSVDIPKVARAYVRGASRRIFFGPISQYIARQAIQDQITAKKAEMNDLLRNNDQRAQDSASIISMELSGLNGRARMMQYGKALEGSEKMEKWRRDLLHASIMLDLGGADPFEAATPLFVIRTVGRLNSKLGIGSAQSGRAPRELADAMTGMWARALFLYNWGSGITNLSQNAITAGDTGLINTAKAAATTFLHLEGWDEPFRNGAIRDEDFFAAYVENKAKGASLWEYVVRNPMKGSEVINRLVAYHAGVNAMNNPNATSAERKQAGIDSINSSQFDLRDWNRNYLSKTVLSPLAFLSNFNIYMLEKILNLYKGLDKMRPGKSGMTTVAKWAAASGIPLIAVYMFGRMLGYDLERKLNPFNNPYFGPLPTLIGGVTNRIAQLVSWAAGPGSIADAADFVSTRAVDSANAMPMEGVASQQLENLAAVPVDVAKQILGTGGKMGSKELKKAAGSLFSTTVPGGLAMTKAANSLANLYQGKVNVGPNKTMPTDARTEALRTLGIYRNEEVDEKKIARVKRILGEKAKKQKAEKPKTVLQAMKAEQRKRIDAIRKKLNPKGK
jgi:predicted RNA methylase